MTSSDPIKGEASSYNLPGMTTANGEKFDPNAFTAAMNGVPLGTEVTVAYNPGGNVTKEINVRVNDRGPFAVDNEGRALRPLQPHPTRVIDLTPAAMKWLTGKETNLINVTVLSPAEKSEPLP
jgi:rare lipoprotein A